MRICRFQTLLSIVLLTLTASPLFATPLSSYGYYNSEALNDFMKEWTIKAQFRSMQMYQDAGYLDAQNGATPQLDRVKRSAYRQSQAIGGYVGLVTPKLFEEATNKNFALSAGGTFFTSQPFLNNPSKAGGLGILKSNQDGYATLGEAYVQLNLFRNTMIRGGRMLLNDYKFLSLSDIRMTPYKHEGVIAENRDFEDITIRLGDVWSMENRTEEQFKSLVYEVVTLKHQGTEWQNIRGSYDPDNYNPTTGAYTGPRESTYLASVALNKESYNIELWNYYFTNFLNLVYLFGNYDFNIGAVKTSLNGQFFMQNDVGNHVAGNIDTWVLGFMATAAYAGFTFEYAINQVRYNENSYDGGTAFIYWGDVQLYNSLIYEDGQLAGCLSNRVGVVYNWNKVSSYLKGLTSAARIGFYRYPSEANDFFNQDRNEYDIDLRYRPNSKVASGVNEKGFDIRARFAYLDFEANKDDEAFIKKDYELNNSLFQMRLTLTYFF